FDAVLVHGDPVFARFDEFFRPREPLRTPVHHTGFVAAGTKTCDIDRRDGIVVSGGGGRFAAPLFMTAIAAHALLKQPVVLTIVAGPFCVESTWHQLVDAARPHPLIRLRRTVTDLRGEMAASRLSISQCGYNTALDIVRAGVPALVVPFAERGETEQTDRARRLEALGVLRLLPADRLDATSLAAEIVRTFEFRPAALSLDLDGATRTARLVKALVGSAVPAGERHIAAHEHLA